MQPKLYRRNILQIYIKHLLKNKTTILFSLDFVIFVIYATSPLLIWCKLFSHSRKIYNIVFNLNSRIYAIGPYKLQAPALGATLAPRSSIPWVTLSTQKHLLSFSLLSSGYTYYIWLHGKIISWFGFLRYSYYFFFSVYPHSLWDVI